MLYTFAVSAPKSLESHERTRGGLRRPPFFLPFPFPLRLVLGRLAGFKKPGGHSSRGFLQSAATDVPLIVEFTAVRFVKSGKVNAAEPADCDGVCKMLDTFVAFAVTKFH